MVGHPSSPEPKTQASGVAETVDETKARSKGLYILYPLTSNAYEDAVVFASVSACKYQVRPETRGNEICIYKLSAEILQWDS